MDKVRYACPTPELADEIIDDLKVVDFASDEGDTGKLQNASIDTILQKL